MALASQYILFVHIALFLLKIEGSLSILAKNAEL
jgi:hypothetical protein